MARLTLVSYLILWVLVIGEGIVILALARQIGVLHKRIAPSGARMTNISLELGATAPPIHQYDLNGRLVALGTGKPTMLIFIAPGCSICETLAPAIRRLYQTEQVQMIIVSMVGDEEENRIYAKQHQLDTLPYIVAPEIATIYEVSATPYAILIDSEGKIHTNGLVDRAEHLESLLNALDEGYVSFDHKMESRVAAKVDPN